MHVMQQFARTLLLWHLFLDSFLAHFRLAHLPGTSTHVEVPAGGGATKHGLMSLGQLEAYAPLLDWAGRQTMRRPSLFTQISEARLDGLTPSSMAKQLHVPASGGGSGGGGDGGGGSPGAGDSGGSEGGVGGEGDK